MLDCSLVVTVKNRLSHFEQIFPSLVTQTGVIYELVIVDFHSNDKLQTEIDNLIDTFHEIISPDLKNIDYVRLNKDLPFNPRQAKNLGVSPNI